MKFDLFYIAFGACLVVFLFYLSSPKPKVVIKHPTLENAKNTVYTDDNGVCYKYKPVEISCDIGDKDISEIN